MYKIGVLNYNSAGIGKYRFVDPHLALQKIASDSFLVNFIEDKEIFDKNFGEDLDFLITHFTLVQQPDRITKIYETKKRNPKLKLVVDIDDYWYVNTTSPLYHTIIKNKIPQKTIDFFKSVDLITTTTEVLKSEINKVCSTPVVILENGILEKDRQFIPNPIASDMIRIGWVGGSSHIDDINMLRGVFGQIISKRKDIQLVLCGFNPLIRDIETKALISDAKKSIWYNYEQTFTDNYALIKDEEYRRFLEVYEDKTYPDINNQPYRRIWTQPVNTYGTAYNHIDICLAPLKQSKFNDAKSELKIIEAGFHNKFVITSDVVPYREIEHKVNGLKVGETRGPKLWVKAINESIEMSLEERNQMANKLHDFVKEKYSAEHIAQKRKKIYLQLLES